MRDDDKPEGLPAEKLPAAAVAKAPAHDDGFEDEEKLLDGHHDVNMPALLTRDVKGG